MFKPNRHHAVIDIGSNATRLHIAHLNSKQQWITDAFTRVPLALGQDVLSSPQNKISTKNIKNLQDIISGMLQILRPFKPAKRRIVATAALRNAQNAPDIVQQISDKQRAKINIISGQEEAKVIGLMAASQFLNCTVLNIDVGGGSTDCAVVRATCAESSAQRSFPISTSHPIHLDKQLKIEFEHWVSNAITNTAPVSVITATGGSVGQLKNVGGELNLLTFNKIKQKIAKMSAEDIAQTYHMPPDTADKLSAAIDIYQTALKCANKKISQIHVVQGGLSDAILYQMQRH